MTNGMSGRRRRVAVSLSGPSDDLIDQLERAVEVFRQVNLALPKTMLDHGKIIVLGRLLTRINGELLTLDYLLRNPAYDGNCT
jgi:hypothetical protein